MVMLFPCPKKAPVRPSLTKPVNIYYIITIKKQKSNDFLSKKFVMTIHLVVKWF